MPAVLLYEFSPDKVSVSLGGDNPIDSFIDLHVKINSQGEAATVAAIHITVPVGAEGETAANRLSANKTLPAPVYDQSAMEGWTIDVDEANGSIVHVTPTDKQPKKLTGTLEFTFQDILVNQTVGIVPITVNEFATIHVTGTFQIDKEDADRPVKRFYVTDSSGHEMNPAVLYDLDQQVTLKWDCTDEGGKGNYSFGLRTTAGETWQPKDCLNRRDCYSCQDGRNGVLTDKLSETGTFALDVIKTEGERRRLHSTLYTTVNVEMPTISENSYLRKYLSGRLISLHWRATNASKCVVELDGEIIDDNARTDTYEDGYLVALTEAPNPHTATLRAVAVTGPAQASKVFGAVSVDSVTITTPIALTQMAITPNGKYALGVSGIYSNQLLRINPVTREVVSIPLGNFPGGIAITVDSKLALITGDDVSVVDIENHKASSERISAGTSPQDIAITQDGNFVLVTDSALPNVYLINIGDWSVEDTFIVGDSRETWGPIAIAETASGRVAVVGPSYPSGNVGFIDLGTRTLEPTAILTDHFVPGPVVTPDGKVALIGNYYNDQTEGTLQVIDIENRCLLPATIPTGPGTIGAATPNCSVRNQAELYGDKRHGQCVSSISPGRRPPRSGKRDGTNLARSRLVVSRALIRGLAAGPPLSALV